MTADNTAPETGNASETENQAKGDAPDIKKMVADAVAEAVRPIASRLNGDAARLRRLVKGRDAQDDGGEDGDDGERSKAKETKSAGVTQDDLWAMRELGKLEAKLPDKLREELEEELKGASIAEQVRAYRIAARAAERAADDDDTKTNRGREAPRTSGRAQPAATRDGGVRRPATKLEYRKLPEAERHKVDQLPDFDYQALPFR